MLKFALIVVFVAHGFSHTSEACENPKEALYVQLKNPIRRSDLCPPENDHFNNLQQVTKKFSWMLGYCLFDRNFQKHEETVCQFELKPIFKSHKQPVNCGLKNKHSLYYFGYYYCGRNDDMERLQAVETEQDLKNYLVEFQPVDLNMYDVCYDVPNHETIHTTHKILEPSSYIDDPQLEQRSNCDCVREISTDPFNMKQETFFEIRDRYKSEEEKSPDTDFKVVPHFIVPPQHFSERTWRRITNHYINTAPLRDKLVPLMNIIDRGIKRAAINVFRATRNEELLIFTTIIKIRNPEYTRKLTNWARKGGKIKKYHFEQNIWCKLVLNEKKNQAIIIYVHNTPEKPTEKKCSSGMTKNCNFQAWSDSTNSCKASASTSTEIHFEYAYCCEATMLDVKDIFNLDLYIFDFLNIDSIINPEK